MPDHLTTASRRRLLASAGLLTAGLGRAPHSAADALRQRLDPDAAVITACSAFNAIERRRLDLIEEPGRVADDSARDQALAPLAGEQQVFLDMPCRRHAVTLPHGERWRGAMSAPDPACACPRAPVRVSEWPRPLGRCPRAVATLPDPGGHEAGWGRNARPGGGRSAVPRPASP